MSKHQKKEANGKDADSKRAKRAAKAARGLALASELTGNTKKKDWEKVAKLLDVDCCDPANRECEDCPLAKKLKSG